MSDQGMAVPAASGSTIEDHSHDAETMLDLVGRLDASRQERLSLVASENRVSPRAIRAMGSDATNRYVLPPGDEKPESIWDYPDQELKLAIYERTARLANALFGSRYADLRPLSGNNAAFCLISSLACRGEAIAHVPADCGGHFATEPICRREGIELLDIPYDRSSGTLDPEGLGALYREKRPRLIFLDASMLLLPYPLADIRQAVGPDAVIAYDASHVMGLIAGGAFQDPLREGCNILNGSTHKTLFGPQKGLILCRDRDAIADRVRETIVPLFVSSAHLHNVAALGVALEELQVHGPAYAAQVIANARALAGALHERGLVIYGSERGFTASHQVWCVLGEPAQALSAFRSLEQIGILANLIHVPFTGRSGLRLGVAELTRRGLREQDLIQLAGIFSDCVQELRPPAELAVQVRELSARHPGMAFCDEQER